MAVNAVSHQDFEQRRPPWAGSQAHKSAQAKVETAHLNLGYAKVRAPIAGRIGQALVTEGALVGQGEATVASRIQQLSRCTPISSNRLPRPSRWAGARRRASDGVDGPAVAHERAVAVY